jgi:replication factor A1
MVRETVVQATEAELRDLLESDKDSLRLSETLDAPDSTPLRNVELGDVVTVVGVVTDIGDRNTFSRDDGSEGQVRNIQIQDRTGMIECALWGDEADRDLSVGDTVQVMDSEAEDGYQDSGLQLNVGYDARFRVFEQDRDGQLVTLFVEDA